MHFRRANNHAIYAGQNHPEMKYLRGTNSPRSDVSEGTLEKNWLAPLASHFITNGPPDFKTWISVCLR